MDEVFCIRGFLGWIVFGFILLDYEFWWWLVVEGGFMGGVVLVFFVFWCLGVGLYFEKKDIEFFLRGFFALFLFFVIELLIWDDCWGKVNINNYVDGIICWFLMYILLLIIKRVIRYVVLYIFMEIV